MWTLDSILIVFASQCIDHCFPLHSAIGNKWPNGESSRHTFLKSQVQIPGPTRFSEVFLIPEIRKIFTIKFPTNLTTNFDTNSKQTRTVFGNITQRVNCAVQMTASDQKCRRRNENFSSYIFRRGIQLVTFPDAMKTPLMVYSFND